MVVTTILKIQYGKHSVKYSAALETGINLFLKCFESTDLTNLKETTVRTWKHSADMNYQRPTMTFYHMILTTSCHVAKQTPSLYKGSM